MVEATLSAGLVLALVLLTLIYRVVDSLPARVAWSVKAELDAAKWATRAGVMPSGRAAQRREPVR